jgi:hypothetical protein
VDRSGRKQVHLRTIRKKFSRVKCEVPPYVFAAGHNDEFIIAKQHPSEDLNTTNYFIIDMHRKIKKKGEKVLDR